MATGVGALLNQIEAVKRVKEMQREKKESRECLKWFSK